MKILNEDIKYLRTDYGVSMEDSTFNELVYRIHKIEKNYEVRDHINFVLNRKVDMLVSLCWDIRDYLIECKHDKSQVDIDRLLNMLD